MTSQSLPQLLLAFALGLLVFGEAVRAQQSGTQEIAVTVNNADTIRAGETVKFTIVLDKAPNFTGGSLQYRIQSPNNVNFGMGVALENGKRQYSINFEVPVAAEGGTWTLKEVAFNSGAGNEIPLRFKPVTFQVIANSNLVYPTAAEVRINPSQTQLLSEALAVQARIQTLKSNLNKTPKPSRTQLIAILQKDLTEALQALERTEQSFVELGGNDSVLEAGKVFFADLKASYRQVIKDVAVTTIQRNDTAFVKTGFVDQPYPLLAQGPLRVLEQNELAYSLVASKEDLTFNLEVGSVPAGATVFYRRRGDSERQNNKPTNSTIASLPYAIWLVRFHLDGYKDEEREHDPFRESNHVLNVELHKP